MNSQIERDGIGRNIRRQHAIDHELALIAVARMKPRDPDWLGRVRDAVFEHDKGLAFLEGLRVDRNAQSASRQRRMRDRVVMQQPVVACIRHDFNLRLIFRDGIQVDGYSDGLTTRPPTKNERQDREQEDETSVTDYLRAPCVHGFELGSPGTVKIAR